MTMQQIEMAVAKYISKTNLTFDGIKVGCKNETSTVWIEKIGNNTLRLRGRIGDLVTTIFRDLGLNFTVVDVPNSNNNEILPNGKPAGGLHAAFTAKKINVAFGAFAARDIFNLQFMFKPIIPATYVLVTPVQTKDYILYGFLIPFDLFIWFGIFLSLFVSSAVAALILCIEKRDNHYDERRDFRHYLGKQLWMFFTNICLQGAIRSNYSKKHSLIVACWALTMFVLINAYCGQLIASLAVKMQEKQIDSLEDLAERPDIPLWVPKGSFNYDLFQGGETEAETILWERIVNEKTMMPFNGTYNAALDFKLLIENKAAFIFERSKIEDISEHFFNCLGYKPFYIGKKSVGNVFNTLGTFFLAVPKNITAEFSKRMVSMYEKGLIRLNVGFTGVKKCPDIPRLEENNVRLDNLKGIFILWIS
ncbi:glutamate receptor ionotropic, kainate 4-like, partial [Centruroides vittatus]